MGCKSASSLVTYRVVIKTSGQTSVPNSYLRTPRDSKSSYFLGTQVSHQAEIVSSSSALLLMKLTGCCVLHSTMEEELCHFENVFLINKGPTMLFRYRGKYFICVLCNLVTMFHSSIESIR